MIDLIYISGGSGLSVVGPPTGPRGPPAPGGLSANLFDALVQKAQEDAEKGPPDQGD